MSSRRPAPASAGARSRVGPGEPKSLPLSATYVIGSDGRIQFADTSVDYRHRTDPLDVLQVLERRVAAE